MPEAPDYSVDPSLFRWAPAATAATATATTKPLVVFDFDRTLSAVHMFEELRTQKGQQEVRRDAPAFYLRMFGGQERIYALRSFLRALSERCTIRVLSFGMEAEIKAALSHLELLDLFDAICGAAAWDRWGLVCTSGGGAKQQMLTCFQRELGCPVLLFADDDLANFPTQAPARRPNKLDGFVLERRTNTRSADWHPLADGGCVQHIFPVGYTGLEESEMAELLQFVGGSDSDSDAVATEPAAQGQLLTRTSSAGSIFRSDSFRSRGVPPESEPEPAPDVV